MVSRFLAWCELETLELARVSPGLVGRFIDEHPGDSATKNQALAALRHFFDTLVTLSAQPPEEGSGAFGTRDQSAELV